MSERISLPITANGNELQAIKPSSVLDGRILHASTANADRTLSPMGSQAVYVYATSAVHVKLSKGGDMAANTDAPVSPGGVVIACSPSDKLSALALSEDAQVWVCPVVA